MKSLLLWVHLLLVGVWLGCVLTEALFERALLGKGHDLELVLVALHKKVDMVVEIPAFMGVLLTGGWMLSMAPPSGVLHTKIGFGLLAIAANVYCVWLVFARARAAQAGQWDVFARLDHRQHVFGAVVLLGLVVAASLGGYLFASA